MIIILRRWPNPGAASVQLALRVPPDDLEGCAAELAAKGVKLIEGPQDKGYGHKTLFFSDPEGSILDIYAEVLVKATNRP